MKWMLGLLAGIGLMGCQDSTRTTRGTLSAGTEEAWLATDQEFQTLLSQVSDATPREELLQRVYRTQLSLSQLFVPSAGDEAESGRCLLLSSQPLGPAGAAGSLVYNATYTLAYSDSKQLAGSCEDLFKSEIVSLAGQIPQKSMVTFFSYSF